MDPCWFYVYIYDVIFKQVPALWPHKWCHHWNATFVLKFSVFTTHLQSNFCYYRCWEHFKMFFHISKGGATEKMMMMGVQKYQFLAKSENLTNLYACSSCKLIINSKCLINIHNLNFPLNIQITITEHFLTRLNQ